jgi:hypothetical protein
MRAFFLRIRDGRTQQIAAVATTGKLAMIVCPFLRRNESFARDRPALAARKARGLESEAGLSPQRGSHRGSAAAYNLKAVRDQERAVAEQAEQAYHRLFSPWKQARPQASTVRVPWSCKPAS